MKSLTFILISLGSGALAGLILAGMNMFVVEPFIDKAIGMETTKAIDMGEHVSTDEQNSYRIWQKSGSFVGGSVLGMAFGSLLGIVYMFCRKAIPFSSDKKRAVFLSLTMCLVLFVVPFIKYPGNPPAVGNPATIWLRESMYIGFLSVSALSALFLGILSYKLRCIQKIRIMIPLFYVVIISVAFVLFPPNPDKISIPMDLVNSFRVMSGLTMVGFWLALGVIFGILWHKYKPHESSKITAM
ncbi:MAG: CbtA family protein [Candidatus Nitrosocosmicus sp.]